MNAKLLVKYLLGYSHMLVSSSAKEEDKNHMCGCVALFFNWVSGRKRIKSDHNSQFVVNNILELSWSLLQSKRTEQNETFLHFRNRRSRLLSIGMIKLQIAKKNLFES